MPKRGWGTKTMAVAGTVLVWLPVLAPILFAVIGLARGYFRFDFLMPAELAPLALAGGLLLLGAALRARLARALIGGSLGAAAALLVGSQAYAVASGLASGAVGMDGIEFVLVVLALVLYFIALNILGAGGIMLLLGLFPPKHPIL